MVFSILGSIKVFKWVKWLKWRILWELNDIFGVLGWNDRRVVRGAMVDDYLLDILMYILENLISLRVDFLSLCVGELAYGPTRNTNICSSF